MMLCHLLLHVAVATAAADTRAPAASQSPVGHSGGTPIAVSSDSLHDDNVADMSAGPALTTNEKVTRDSDRSTSKPVLKHDDYEPAVFRKPFRAQWFRDARYGVQASYVSDLRHCPKNCTEGKPAGWHRSCKSATCPCTDCIKSADEWNEMIDNFDVDAWYG